MTKPLKEPSAPLKLYYDNNAVVREKYKSTDI